MRTIVLLLAWTFTSAASNAALLAEFDPGTGAEYRYSANYLIADTLGQFLVGESFASDSSYSCAWIEHGFWHSDIDIPSVSDLKDTDNGYWIDVYSKVVTAGSDQFSREFYITDAITDSQNINGIRVYLGSNPLVVSTGDIVDVSGIIRGTTAARYIEYPEASLRFQNMSVSPWFIPNRWLGGKGTDVIAPGGAGVLNTGLLVRTTGRVTYVDTNSPCRYFYVDDGSGMTDGLVIGGLTMRGIRVWISGLAVGNTITPPPLNSFVIVTGICTTYSTSVGTRAQIRPRLHGDIQ